MVDPRLEDVPRVRLGCLPTPLHPAPRLSAELGIEVWLKRDDLTGLGLGGNKVRVLEFLLGAALEDDCDVLVTGSGPQSNWSMLASLAARRCGLDSVLCFYGDAPQVARGNLLLLQEFTGAHVTYTGDPERSSVDVLIEQTARRLRAAGRRPLALPRGGATARGSLGYVAAAMEIRDQGLDHGIDDVTVWLGTGSCGTQAGLTVGAAGGLLGRVVGVTVSRPAQECRTRVLELAAGAAALLGLRAPDTADVEVLDGWIGPGYGVASSEGRAAAALVARTEGILLDPVFGSKAMAALIAEAGAARAAGPVVFLVSGGAPTLFTQGGGL